ncbi:NADPH:quinone oxidoreductase family protein [Candidatus Halocynthiibacter alkanivorans]|uniref:NADPH:quinone oxidoreductase family protein n=1 Tax=Candidatus Halocynthiibacter alkanivorans TaxID=2267619 RepID=UPI0013593588|nr:NADPH:quinone oxidoreductase family protein [Candidatus Halocynthiibacter alkanivorans]
MTEKMSSTMRCWVAGEEPGLENMELTTRPRPVAKPGYVVVKTEAAALNFSDILMVDEKYQVRPPRPFTPGQEVAGTIVEVAAVSQWNVGDRIASKVLWGGFAEYTSVREDMMIPVPDQMSFSEAAALPVVYLTSMVALHDCVSVGPDDRVLVHAAAGGVGLAAVEIAHAAGAQVIATAGSTDKLALAAEHGADVLINYRDEDWKDQVNAATDGLGATIIVDPVGGDVAIQSLRCIARRGALLIVGFASGKIAQLPSNYLLLKNVTARGVVLDHDRDADVIRRLTGLTAALLEQGKIKPVVDTRFELSDLPQALKALGRRETVGKLVLRVHSQDVA